MSESRELAAYWLGGGTAPVWYLADPARGDLELVDPLSVRLQAHYNWKFPRESFMSGVRPDVVDLVRIDSPPGWFAETGWHLTPETLNFSERQGRSEGIAHDETSSGGGDVGDWRRKRRAGWRQAGARVGHDRRPCDQGMGASGGRPIFSSACRSNRGCSPGTARSAGWWLHIKGADGRPERVRLTQLMIAPPDAVFFVPHAGWNELEYSDQMQRSWRWTTGRAETFVNSGGHDVTLTLAGSRRSGISMQPPNVTVRAGNQVLATAQPDPDFDLRVKVPAAALAASDGMITIETDKTFVPHEQSGSPDRRTLGLRIFEIDGGVARLGFAGQAQDRASDRHVDSGRNQFRLERERSRKQGVDRLGRNIEVAFVVCF